MNEDTVHPLVKVWVATFGAITISLSDVLHIFQIASLIVAIAYTLWKWRQEARKKQTKESE